MRRLLPTLLLLTALLLGACRPASNAPSGALPVVATFSILGDLVQQVGGEHVQVTTLVAAGTDAHTFSPSPADGAALARARLVFENGLGFEPWLDDLYTASGTQAPRVAVTDGLELIAAEDDDHAAGAGEHSDYDPHAWHSVAHTMGMVRAIRDSLAQADPAHAAAYEARAEAYLAQLQSLDEWVFEQVEAVPPAQRKLVTTHDTFGYFAERYGFTVVGTLLPTTTEGASPSAQELAALVEAVRAAGVPAVFAESVTANDLLSQVAAEAGVRVVAPLFTDALGPPGSPAETYLDLMRYNVTTITEALGA